MPCKYICFEQYFGNWTVSVEKPQFCGLAHLHSKTNSKPNITVSLGAQSLPHQG